jgi:hypothetical protein
LILARKHALELALLRCMTFDEGVGMTLAE